MGGITATRRDAIKKLSQRRFDFNLHTRNIFINLSGDVFSRWPCSEIVLNDKVGEAKYSCVN